MLLDEEVDCKIFYLAFIIQLSVYSKLYAHTDIMGSTSTENPVKSGHSIFGTSKHDFDFAIKTIPLLSEKQMDKIDPTDNEDEEDELATFKLTSFKKFSVVNNYFTHTAATPVYLTFETKKSVPVSGHLFYAPVSRWYILFRVFRI